MLDAKPPGRKYYTARLYCASIPRAKDVALDANRTDHARDAPEGLRRLPQRRSDAHTALPRPAWRCA